MSGSPSYSYPRLSLLLGFHLFTLRFSNLEKFSLDLGVATSSKLIQSFPLQETQGSLTFTHLEGRQEMGLCRKVITRCLNYNPRGPAVAMSAWFDLP